MPLDYLKQTIIRQPASAPIGELALETHALGDLEAVESAADWA
jgi:hypothetical protein